VNCDSRWQKYPAIAKVINGRNVILSILTVPLSKGID